jgi:hypothetical protein
MLIWWLRVSPPRGRPAGPLPPSMIAYWRAMRLLLIFDMIPRPKLHVLPSTIKGPALNRGYPG